MTKKKIMIVLYYTSKQNCRADCDTLGIDRRRVTSLRNGHQCLAGFTDDAEPQPIFRPAVAVLKVSQDLIDEAGIENLLHDDDETYF